MNGSSTCTCLLLSLLLALNGSVGMATGKEDHCITTEMALVQEVVHAELIALGFSDRKDLCLDVEGKSPTGELMRRLRANGVLVHKGSWCSKGPRGVGILVQSITITNDLRAEVEVETANENLSEGQHFAILLRKGTYFLERKAKGTWGIVAYKKLCCPAKD